MDEQLYQSWLLELQAWATEGHLFSVGVDELRLKPALVTKQLIRIDNRLAKGETQDLPPIEELPGYGIPVSA